MKEKIVAQAKAITQQASKIGQDGLSRLRKDLSKKEYVVFVEPVARRINQTLHKSEDTDAHSAEADLGAGLAVPISQEEADSRLVDEVFFRPEPVVGQAEDRIENESQSTELTPDSEASVSVEEESEVAASADPVVAETPSPKTPAAKPANGPMVRTMVEAIPDLADGEEGLGDILMDDLHDIFTTVTYTNAKTKALLKSREPVDIRELAKELQDYAESIGASPSRT